MRVLKSSAPEPGPERDSVLGKEANTRVKVESTYDDYVPPPELVQSYEGYLDNAGEQKPDTSTLIKHEGKQLGLALSLLAEFLRDPKMIINHRGNCNLPLQNSKPGTM